MSAPRSHRRADPRLTLHYALGHCWLGAILVGMTPAGVCAVLLGDEPEPLVRDLRRRFPAAALSAVAAEPTAEVSAELAATLARVIRRVESPHTDPELALDLHGTPFRRRVWRALQDIPAGTTLTYTQLARRLGMPTAARAVAAACAANPVAVVIPCHRMVRADGGLAGYRWGLQRKAALLAREAANARPDGVGSAPDGR